MKQPLVQPTLQRMRALLISALLSLGVLLVSTNASADHLRIKNPGLHPDYSFEAEPHLLLEPFDKFGPGGGFRGTIELVDNGFIRRINNTVGIGFGADITQKSLYIPVVMQWNFWLSDNWSVFGEPGGMLRLRGKGKGAADFLSLFVGGRWHFAKDMSLTMRVGHPSFSVGVSFFL